MKARKVRVRGAGIAGFGAVVFVLVLATAFADRIECEKDAFCEGTRRADVIVGTHGIDNVDAKRGADFVRGRRGDDNALRGGRGRDTIRGGTGNEALVGGRGFDQVLGGDGSDSYNYADGWGQEEIVDAPVVDADLNTGNGIRFDFVTGDLTIRMASGTGPEVTVLGAASTLDWENDTIDVAIDGQGDDLITGRAVGDNIQLIANAGGPGGSGDDTIQSGGGDDFIYVADGEPDDAVSCGAGANDNVRADAGDSIDTTDCEDIDVL